MNYVTGRKLKSEKAENIKKVQLVKEKNISSDMSVQH